MELGIDEKIEIHPCTEEGLVTLEAQLGENGEKDYFDVDEMSAAIRYSPFKDLKFSKEMGYAFALYKGKRIHIFKNGKIIIRRADDEEDALRVLKMCIKSLIPAVICECRRPVISCYRGEVAECMTKGCRTLKKLIRGEPRDVTFLDILKNPPARFKRQWLTFKKITDMLEDPESMDPKGMRDLIEAEKKAIFKHMIGSVEAVQISTSLSFLALYENIEDILGILSEAPKEGDRAILRHLHEILRAVMDGDRKTLESLQGRNEELAVMTASQISKDLLEYARRISRSVLMAVLK